MASTYTYRDRVRKFSLIRILPFFLVCFFVGLYHVSLLKALVFGLILTVVLLSAMGLYAIADYIALRIAFKKFGTVDYGIKQFRELEVRGNKSEVIRYVLNAVNKLNSIRKLKTDENKGIVEVIRRKRLGAQGENITIEVVELSNNNSLIRIWSKPPRKRVIFDLANNYKNVEKVVANLKNSMR